MKFVTGNLIYGVQDNDEFFPPLSPKKKIIEWIALGITYDG